MQRRKFRQNKLWRDKAVEWLESAGSKLHWKRLDDAEFAEELKTKLLEEANEVCTAKSPASLCEEMADVLEVLASFCELHAIPLEEVIRCQHEKRQERGGFSGRKYITLAEHPIGSFGEAYCLNDPEKYPEMFE